MSWNSDLVVVKLLVTSKLIRVVIHGVNHLIFISVQFSCTTGNSGDCELEE